MLQIGDLDRKRVLVTGASSGIGAAVVQAFAQQGAQVALHFRSHAPAANALAERIRGGGGTVVLVQGDLSESGVAARVVEEAARRFRIWSRVRASSSTSVRSQGSTAADRARASTPPRKRSFTT